ncbi:hypothetical protein MUG94_10575 [Arthrobacter gengyunqii]|uniref:META domain-containing protein n=1 Tax=Arthrobacter gengyunqii TaxID=2886940 RepID=A0A9X1S8J3_9MICC|nr:hypothetical protein [Arthrobacter gengyunqii]MCC3270059.1 hypothetical protein [Arthrobacter gengyunqii]UOY95027.1 hypothetical protein MUG94_10575 [Arthrobacter gengyunqii]
MSRKQCGIAVPGIAAVSFAALILSGCSADPTNDGVGSTASIKPTRSVAAPVRTPSPTPPAGPVKAPSIGGMVLAQLENQTGTGVIEGIPTDSETLSFAADCYGAGTLEVAVPGLVTFSQECSADALKGHMNSVETRFFRGSPDVAVTVTANDNVHWALTVSGSDRIQTAPLPVPTSG